MTAQLTIEEALAERDAVLHLLELDARRADPATCAVAAAIDMVARPGDYVSANEVRPHLPGHVSKAHLGQAWAKLVRLGALRKYDWVPSTDPGTHGKPVTRYEVLGSALAALPTDPDPVVVDRLVAAYPERVWLRVSATRAERIAAAERLDRAGRAVRAAETARGTAPQHIDAPSRVRIDACLGLRAGRDYARTPDREGPATS